MRLVESPPAVALAVLGYPDMPTAAEAVPALLPHAPVALEGMDARLVEVVRTRRGAAAVPDLPRGARLAVRRDVRRDRDRGARPRPRSSIADAGCLDSAIVTGAPARALWRIREDGAGLGGRTPAGAPAWPGWEDAAVRPEHLGAYLREFDGADAPSTTSTGCVYGHFGDGCVHVRIDFPLARRPRPLPRVPHRRRRSSSASTAGRCPASTATGGPAANCCRTCTRADALATFAAVKRAFDPANLLNPGVIVDPAPVERDLRVPPARPLHDAASRSPTRTTAATCRPPCTAASASASAAPTPPRPAA